MCVFTTCSAAARPTGTDDALGLVPAAVFGMALVAKVIPDWM